MQYGSDGYADILVMIWHRSSNASMSGTCSGDLSGLCSVHKHFSIDTFPQYGSGKHTVARVCGDDEVQLWGRWEFQGPAVGIYQGLYAMYETYGPYKPLISVTMGAQV